VSTHTDDLARMDATAQAELIRRGDVAPTDAVDAAIARIETLNPTLNAVIHPAFERARDAVRRGIPSGPFGGVPTLMKDIGGAEAGAPYHAGLSVLKRVGWREPQDSYFTQLVRAGGLVSLGRTNTPELALLPTTEPAAYGPTRNPWNPDYSAGGSSGGAAAAVAAGIVPVAHASDGGGSIRIPASTCGLVGLKPTRGRCSFGPQLGERWNGFSCEFFVTRSVRDAAALLDVVAGPMPGDPYAAPPPRRPFAESVRTPPGALRIGLMRVAPGDLPLAAEALAGVERVAAALAALGHHVEEAHPDALLDQERVGAYVQIVSCNTARALESWSAAIGEPITAQDVEPLTWTLAESGRAATATALLGAIDYVHAYGRRLAAWWESGWDLLLTPTQAAPPPPLGYLTSTSDEPFRAFLRAVPYGAYTFAFNMSGQPAISLPATLTPAGLPIGAQLVGRWAAEDVLLQVAAQLEEALAWGDARPPIHAG
jgi:amidase